MGLAPLGERKHETIMADTPVRKTTRKTATAKKTPARKPRATRSKAKEETPVDHRNEAKDKFSKALEEAKAGVSEMRAGAVEKAEAYRAQAKDKSGELLEDAKVYGEQAKTRARELAVEGKARTSETIASLGKLVSDNAGTIDERFGEKYGDYARSASKSLADTAAKIEAKNLDELGDDAREFVRKSPGLAVGLAAVAGFMLASLFRRR